MVEVVGVCGYNGVGCSGCRRELSWKKRQGSLGGRREGGDREKVMVVVRGHSDGETAVVGKLVD